MRSNDLEIIGEFECIAFGDDFSGSLDFAGLVQKSDGERLTVFSEYNIDTAEYINFDGNLIYTAAG